MKKKGLLKSILAIVLTLAMVLGAVPLQGIVLSARAGGLDGASSETAMVIGADGWTTLVNVLSGAPGMMKRTDVPEDANHPTYLKLESDCVSPSPESSGPIEVASGRYVVLDLNGHTIDRGLADESAVGNGNVITVEGNLTITDSSENRAGNLTGGNNYKNGGGVRVFGENNAVFTLNGGSITGCKSDDSNYGHGGGVFCGQGKFIMNGGSISHCTGIQGGGVYVDDNCTFNMTGGTISQNSGNEIGGVYVLDGTFNMTGGTISGNTATDSGDNRAGGVSINKGTFKVSGTPVIKSNTKNGSASNIVFYSDCSDKTIKVTDELGTGAEIYVNANSGETVAQGSNYAPTASDAAYFHSDNDASLVGVLDGGNIKLASAWGALQTKLNTDGTVTLDRDYTAGSSDSALVVPEGKTVTLDLNGHTIDRGLTNASAKEDGYVITVNGNLTLKDSGTNGKITGGHNLINGGGVYNYGTFTMTGGSITGNTANEEGGGVCNNAGSTFTMTGGNINGNAAKAGGGVYNNGTFTMTGGSIAENTATGDNCHGGGVGNFARATFNVSGRPVISGNNANNTSDNVRFGNNPINVISALDSNAEIHVKVTSGQIVAKGSGGYQPTASDAAKFVCDNESYAPLLDSTNNTIKMAQAYTITVADGISNGNVTAPARAAAGATVTLTVTPGEGYIASSVSYIDGSDHTITPVNGVYSFTMPAANVTVSATFEQAVVQVGDDKYTTVQGAINAAPANGTVTLLSDVNINTYLTIASGKTVTLDLNGYTIDRGLTGGTAVDNGYVIMVDGNLTLQDNSSLKTGKITGGNDANGLGGGVYVDGGTFTMQGGMIIGNQALPEAVYM